MPKHTLMRDPTANYTSPSVTKQFNTEQYPESHHTTNGRTTGPSQFVLDAGAIDKDIPSQPNNTYLGQLRAKVTTLQDDLNEFLTERMKQADIAIQTRKEEEMEKKLLDGADDDSDDE